MAIPQHLMACFLVISSMPIAVGLADETSSPSPLQLESKIPLGEVSGRIDHLAIDLPRRRLFVAELGNNSVGVVDLSAGKVRHVITELKEPQGVGYAPWSDTLFVTNAGDGSVRLFHGADYDAAGRIDLGNNADNVRVDPTSNRVFVGYGNGALAVIDTATNGKIADIPLHAHPESFQIARADRRIFVNVPKAREIAVIDRFAGKQAESWAIDNDRFFPMALDEESGRVLVALRNPAQLAVFSTRDGKAITTVDTCGDADDLFVDARRQRAYLICGDGYLDVFEANENAYRRSAHIPTISGARTALFVPEIDRLFVVARESPNVPAAVWVFRPTP